MKKNLLFNILFVITIFILLIFFYYNFINSSSINFVRANQVTDFLKLNLPVFIEDIDIGGRSFRNPFQDFRSPQMKQKQEIDDEETQQVISDSGWENIPFILRGIISYNDKAIALVSYDGSSRLLKKDEQINGYLIADILEEAVIITKDEYAVKMEIGGNLVTME